MVAHDVFKKNNSSSTYNIMSIVALKRKTEARYNNLSVNQKQFSINGTTRNQGYIGQTSLSRSLIHTPSKGAVLKDFNGRYANPNIKASETISLEDNTVVKPSVLSFKGMMFKSKSFVSTCRPAGVKCQPLGSKNPVSVGPANRGDWVGGTSLRIVLSDS